MNEDATREEQLKLARGIIELVNSIGDSSELTGQELAYFDMRRNEILEDVGPNARRLAELVLRREHNES